MDLVDLLDENGLQQDEWSLTKPVFGKDGQLQVVGWSGKYASTKLYIVKCNKCSEDSELFGEGYFKHYKGDLKRGYLPCGCTRSPRWSHDQYIILCKRAASKMGYTFLGFAGEWKNQQTKVSIVCTKHGEWGSGRLHAFINRGSGCPKCKAEAAGELARIVSSRSDEHMINSFFVTNGFHPDTKFWKSTRKTKQGALSYWHMSCPECGEVGESASGNLQKGHRCCGCSRRREREGYINIILDKSLPLALKFGVTSDSYRRCEELNSCCVYEVENLVSYVFPDRKSCLQAERECKQTLITGVIDRVELTSGFTETTYIYNLDKIIEIYERNGGIKNDRN